MDHQAISQLLAAQTPGKSLDQAFYRDPDIYERDVEKIYLRAWLYAGHESEIPNAGDYLLFDFAGESVIVVRSKENEINALINVCKHRGSRVCLDARGRAKRLTCRYHGWTYDLDGSLLGAASMPENFDKSAAGLKKIHVEVLDGMVFVNFADEPASFESIRKDLTDCLRPYQLEKAKVAHRASYPIAANWKLAVENYSECYHCAPAHPEYSLGHGLAIPEEDYADLLDAVMARASACGLSERSVRAIYLDSDGFGNDRGYERYPMLRGHVTGSRTGEPVAPLLGAIKDYDGGTTDFQVGPVTFALAYCDHVVIYRFTPLAVDSTDCDISWLVRADAEAGKDYDVQKLTWLWDITTHADQHIIERNQEGVNSRFYEPGTYSKMEDFTQRFVDWYVAALK